MIDTVFKTKYNVCMNPRHIVIAVLLLTMTSCNAMRSLSPEDWKALLYSAGEFVKAAREAGASDKETKQAIDEAVETPTQEPAANMEGPGIVIITGK